MFAIDLDICDIILEHSGDVDLDDKSESVIFENFDHFDIDCRWQWWMRGSGEGADKGESSWGLRKSLGGSGSHTSGNVPLEKTLEEESVSESAKLSIDTYINKQVFPQAPSPTMTSLRRISAMTAAGKLERGE